MMASIEQFIRELYWCIKSFKARIGPYLWEVQVLYLLGLCGEVAALRYEMYLLAEIHILFIPLVIPSFTQLLDKTTTMIFNLFAKDDEAIIYGVKRGCEVE